MSTEHYIYKFENEQNKIIYVGRTKNLINRVLNEHFTLKGHLDKNCYDETKKVYYSSVSANEARIYEIYLINKYSPMYNETYNNGEVMSLQLPEPKWIELAEGFFEGDIKYINRKELYVRLKDEIKEKNIIIKNACSEINLARYGLRRNIGFLKNYLNNGDVQNSIDILEEFNTVDKILKELEDVLSKSKQK